MPKKQDDMAERLQAAALELFEQHGYDRTTAAKIAERAGVTERTFFRYYSDKREVLFGGQAAVLAALTATIASAPTNSGPLEALSDAFRSMLSALETNRSWLTTRHVIISATPALQEREIMKMNALGKALADALQARGTSPLHAALAAKIGLVAFEQATAFWLDNPAVALREQLDLTLQEARILFAH